MFCYLNWYNTEMWLSSWELQLNQRAFFLVQHISQLWYCLYLISYIYYCSNKSFASEEILFYANFYISWVKKIYTKRHKLIRSHLPKSISCVPVMQLVHCQTIMWTAWSHANSSALMDRAHESIASNVKLESSGTFNQEHANMLYMEFIFP